MTTTLHPPNAAAIFEKARNFGVENDLAYAGAVTPEQAWELARGGAARIIDVRSRFEFEFVGSVPGSQLIEWRTYEGNADGGVTSRPNPAFLEQLRLLHELDTPLLLLCRSAVRSHNAAIAATRAGFSNLYNILEGFEGDKDATGRRGHAGGWRKANLPWTQG